MAAPDALSQQAADVTERGGGRDQTPDRPGFRTRGPQARLRGTQCLALHPVYHGDRTARGLSGLAAAGASRCHRGPREKRCGSLGRLQAAAEALAAMTALDLQGPDSARHQAARAYAVGRARAAVHTLHRQLSELGENVGDTMLATVRAVDDAQLRLDGDLPRSVIPPGSGPLGTIPSPLPEANQSAAWKAHWRAVIQDVASGGRAALLAALSDLGPVIVREGGTAAGQKAVQALLDAGRWWP